jgi:hypothetical protein
MRSCVAASAGRASYSSCATTLNPGAVAAGSNRRAVANARRFFFSVLRALRSSSLRLRSARLALSVPSEGRPIPSPSSSSLSSSSSSDNPWNIVCPNQALADAASTVAWSGLLSSSPCSSSSESSAPWLSILWYTPLAYASRWASATARWKSSSVMCSSALRFFFASLLAVCCRRRSAMDRGSLVSREREKRSYSASMDSSTAAR